MTNRLITLLTLCVLCLSTVNAQTKEYTLKIGDFKEFTVSDHINVNYKYNTDSAGFANFTTDRRIASAITFSNAKDKLKIEIISDTPINAPLPTITIYSSRLDKATNLGDSTVCLINVKESEKLSLKVMGNGLLKALDVATKKFSAVSEAGSGHIYAQGTCEEANYLILGAGVIECGSMVSPKVSVKMAGTGSVDCTAQETLAVYGLGSGSVYYAGDPEIKRRNLGVKIIQINR